MKSNFFLFPLLWLLACNPVSPSTPWLRHTIDAEGSGADGVKLGDINQDGRMDIVTGWEESGLTKLYLHPGTKTVKESWPLVVVGKTPKVEDAVFADLNGDGRLDIVSCSEKGVEKIYIHWGPANELLNPAQWKQVVLPASEKVTMWMYAEALQLDGQNGTDLIAAGKGEHSSLGWFEAPENPNDLEGWQWHPISSVGWMMSIILHDMDGDADMDIVITDRRGELRACRWLENPGYGSEQKTPWLNHLIGAAGLEVMFMDIADLDGDGEEEVIVSERSEQSIRIYQRQNPGGTQWQEKVLSLPENIGTAKSVSVGDINGDEVPDLVISTNTNGEAWQGLFWWDGTQLTRKNGPELQSISGAHNAKYDKVELIDLDADGDLDVLICEENYGEESEGLGVIWYENGL